MTDMLPIGLEELLSGVAVESSRLEFKSTWNEGPTGSQVLATLCAFANDLNNDNGGYVVIGIAEKDGHAVRPAIGLAASEIEKAQKWLRGNCKRIEPRYFPRMIPGELDGKSILVLWAAASDVRPHQAPNPRDGLKAYFVRMGSETCVATGDVLGRLLEQVARIPFDDRRNMAARLEDIRESRVREFLRDVRSTLVDQPNAYQVYRNMGLTQKVNGHELPRNVTLLFFSDDPEQWFRGVRIEVVQFSDGAGGNTIEEREFRGPVHEQLRACLNYLGGLGSRHIFKFIERSEATAWSNYPSLAVREAIVNAVHHRGYEGSVEPIKVYWYPDRIEIISYPGPLDGIDVGHFSGPGQISPVPARNRRIGEYLNELRLAEQRSTGVPKIFRSMRENGSPDPRFDFDVGRTYFRVTLPAHP